MYLKQSDLLFNNITLKFSMDKLFRVVFGNINQRYILYLYWILFCCNRYFHVNLVLTFFVSCSSEWVFARSKIKCDVIRLCYTCSYN